MQLKQSLISTLTKLNILNSQLWSLAQYKKMIQKMLIVFGNVNYIKYLWMQIKKFIETEYKSGNNNAKNEFHYYLRAQSRNIKILLVLEKKDQDKKYDGNKKRPNEQNCYRV